MPNEKQAQGRAQASTGEAWNPPGRKAYTRQAPEAAEAQKAANRRYHRAGEPNVLEIRLDFIHLRAPIAKLATVALWNLLTKRPVIDGTDPTLALIHKFAPERFEELVQQPVPTFWHE